MMAWVNEKAIKSYVIEVKLGSKGSKKVLNELLGNDWYEYNYC